MIYGTCLGFFSLYSEMNRAADLEKPNLEKIRNVPVIEMAKYSNPYSSGVRSCVKVNMRSAPDSAAMIWPTNSTLIFEIRRSTKLIHTM